MSKIVEEVIAAKHIRSHPLVPRYVPLYGYIYDVRSGRLVEVKDATVAGRST